MDFPVLVVLNTGLAYLDQPFNLFFSVMACMGTLIMIPAAIFGAIRLAME